MRDDSVSAGGEASLICTYYNRLKDHILDQLPAAYSRHNSSHMLKSFSIRVTGGEHDHFTVIAVAHLAPPESLAAGFEILLEDEFIEISSSVGAIDALEQLQDEVKRRIEKKRKDPYAMKDYGSCYSFW